MLLVEVDGLDGGVAAQVEAMRDDRVASTARAACAVAADDAERALLWKGRKSAFGAIARIAPDYYLHDAVVPRTRLVEVLRAVYEIADAHELITMNVFHAGDGNLHPLDRVRRARARRVGARARRPATRSSTTCIDAGGVLTGEHGVGIEKRDLMPLMFTADDLDAQARLRDAFDPDGARQPREGAAAREPLRRAAAGPGGRVDLTAAELDALDDVAIVRRRHGRAGGRGTQWEVGGPPPDGRSRSRAPAGVVDVRARRHDGHRRRRHDRSPSSTPSLAEHGQECPLDPRDPRRDRRRRRRVRALRASAGCGTARCATRARGALRHRRRAAASRAAGRR